MAERIWDEELEFIRRWRGDDPFGRAGRARPSRGDAEPAPSPGGPVPPPLSPPGSPPLSLFAPREPVPSLSGRSRVETGAEFDTAVAPGSAGIPPTGARFLLADPEADRSIRTAFPAATIDFPGDAYSRIIHPLGPGAGTDPELARLPGNGLLFDLETLGFHGRPLFLIGLLFPDDEAAKEAGVPVEEGAATQLRATPADGAAPTEHAPFAEKAREAENAPDAEKAPRWSRWRVVQLLARDYAEEEAIIAAFIGIAAETAPWVSFNGKAFDLPFLRERARHHRLVIPEPRGHRDLLHAARRVYRGVLPNCRLQTLETALFSRYRRRDLPGEEIPAAYHAFVRTGAEDDMVRILRHNRDDLVTLARLHVHLGEDEAPRSRRRSPRARATPSCK